MKATNTQIISATQVRNNFFNLLTQGYLKQQTYIIKKGGIPLMRLAPLDDIHFDYIEKAEKKISLTKEQTDQLALLEEMAKIRKTMKKTSDSAIMLRKMRRHGK